MNGKKARELRKKLGITNQELKNPEYEAKKTQKKIVYFRSRFGKVLTPQEVTREIVINKTKKEYKQAKKNL